MVYLPCSNIPRRYDRFTRSTENASQIESFITSGLNIVTELNNNNVGHRVAVLIKTKKTLVQLNRNDQRALQHSTLWVPHSGYPCEPLIRSTFAVPPLPRKKQRS